MGGGGKRLYVPITTSTTITRTNSVQMVYPDFLKVIINVRNLVRRNADLLYKCGISRGCFLRICLLRVVIDTTIYGNMAVSIIFLCLVIYIDVSGVNIDPNTTKIRDLVDMVFFI